MIQFFYEKILLGFDKIWITKNPKMFDSSLISVKSLLSVSARFPKWRHEIPLCAVVNIEVECSNACRNARILSREIIFSLMKSGKLVDFFWLWAALPIFLQVITFSKYNKEKAKNWKFKRLEIASSISADSWKSRDRFRFLRNSVTEKISQERLTRGK